LLVKNRIKKEWFSLFGKCKDKEYYSNYCIELDILQYNSFKDFFQANFAYKKIDLLEFLFPQIQLKYIVTKPLYETTFNDEHYRDGKFGVIYNGKIEEFNRITSLEIESYGIFQSKDSNQYDDIYLTNNINDSSFNLHLNSFNKLNGEFSLIGEFSGDYSDYTIIDFNGLNFHAKVKITGLLKNQNYPAWMEYVIDGILNYQNQDYKMSILNSYSAFENFVTVIHDIFIFEYLAHKTKKQQSELLQLKNFGQEKKRLFQKAKDVISFLGLDDLQSVLDQIETYEKTRHKIAHGTIKNSTLSEENFQDIIYCIISFILSISINENLNASNWQTIIKKI
jgi:hypothetical protein